MGAGQAWFAKAKRSGNMDDAFANGHSQEGKRPQRDKHTVGLQGNHVLARTCGHIL